MKKYLLVLLGCLVAFPAFAQRIKVACIGNSITHGAGVDNREKNCYPAQLQEFLGDTYEVLNFGVSATTLLTNGDFPYITTDAYRASLEYQPDIVLIKLGTNDSKPRNRHLLATEYVADYTRLVESYRALGSHPQVVLLTPTKCYTDDDISDSVISGRVIPLIREVAYANGTEIVNLHNVFGAEHDAVLMPDRVHPSSIGAGLLAKKIGTYILTSSANDGTGKPQIIAQANDSRNFYGFPQYNFNLQDGNESIPCHIVAPRREAPGRPWVWRARFWGHEPQLDIDLLEKGFHVAYCDVSELFGSQRAVKRWDRFYEIMQANGFHKKAVLEGMSRGGLIVYNWAVRNPEKVAAIYADAPVMDLGSWPLGYDPTSIETQRMLKAYGFKSAGEVEKWNRNPVDHAKAMAKSNIPILHVVGDADEAVPVAQNTAVFQERYRAARGNRMQVIHKANVGHHPHSLWNPEPITRFILEATGRWDPSWMNECVHPVPGNAYHASNGWVEGNEWHAISEDITATLNQKAGKRLKLLLIGNSITQGFGGDRKLVNLKPGLEAMNETLGAGNWETAGIGSDRTQHLVWRIRYGNYNIVRPENVVITIGINNLGAGNRPEDVAAGIQAVVQEAVRTFPESRIFVLGPLPAGREPHSWFQTLCKQTHAALAGVFEAASDPRVSYVNPTGWFTDSAGWLHPDYYTDDQMHLSEAGYRMWSGKIAELIR